MHRNELEIFVNEQHMTDYVHFLGNCFDMQNYYLAAHIYVHSSPMEGLPTVLLEALIYNVPIAAIDSIPGVMEIFGYSECRLISPVGQWKELGENIEKLYDDDSLRNELTKRGKDRIQEFASDVAIDKLLQFISSI